eukprot:Nk52_evm41s62 gene=Nk52_evmTU41s62
MSEKNPGTLTGTSSASTKTTSAAQMNEYQQKSSSSTSFSSSSGIKRTSLSNALSAADTREDKPAASSSSSSSKSALARVRAALAEFTGIKSSASASSPSSPCAADTGSKEAEKKENGRDRRSKRAAPQGGVEGEVSSGTGKAKKQKQTNENPRRIVEEVPIPDEEDYFDGDDEFFQLAESMNNDAYVAFLYVKSCVQFGPFADMFPPIVMKHQLYCILKDRTIADRQLNDLKEKGVVRVYTFGFSNDEMAVVLSEDLGEHIRCKIAAASEYLPQKEVLSIERFVKNVMEGEHREDTIGKNVIMRKYGFSDQEVTTLIRFGLLTMRDLHSFWLAIPGMGSFRKHYINGRTEILKMIDKAKYHEMLFKDLKVKKLKNSKLSTEYHMYDVIGADKVNW